MEHVFVLGCERSGTTWLLNIFDAHPDVRAVMEPLVEAADLFPDLPPRNVPVPDPDPALVAHLRDGFDRLPDRMTGFLYRAGAPEELHDLEDALLHGLARLARAVGRSAPRFATRYRELHAHRRAVPARMRPAKRSDPTHVVTKELRLNLKVPLLAAAFPQATVAVMVRHPGAQIASVARLLDEGGLGELERSLATFVEDCRSHPRLAPYADAVEPEGRHERLAFWWAVNYDVLLSDAASVGLDPVLVRHEALARDPLDVSRDLMDRVGLETTATVRRFVRWSSTTSPDDPEALDTRRDSEAYVEQAIRAVPDRLEATIRDVLDRLDADVGLDPRLPGYLERFGSS